ncbi:MAG: fibronectin type III domain-containing protein, partial [Crocinitomicaceae bacterium]
YYNYLSYYADENQHLQAIVTLTDFTAGPVDCRLRISIEGPGYELRTNPNLVIGVPFTLNPGVPNFINGIDLAPYLQESNLIIEPSGVNIDALPEGFTTICIDVIRDGATQEVLSTNNCTGFFLQRFQPAQALMPMCASNISVDEVFHTFQWAPPIGYVPSIGSELSYTFSLYEWIDQSNFNIFETGQGLVYTAQTTTPLVQLSNYDVLLQEGMTYVWRIESQITSNGIPIDMIVNNGISAPCTFTYGEAVSLEESLVEGLVINLEADGTGERKGNAYWTVIDNTPNEGLSTYEGYLISYRKKPTGSESFEYEWVEDDIVNNTFNYKIFQLEPNTTYEVFVQGKAGTFLSEPSNTAEFTTLEEREYACGESDMPYMPENYNPLIEAMIGMNFQIGQFTMMVTEIENLSTAGHFKGKGSVPIAFLGGASAKVRFDDILVDDEFRVREGQVDVITDGLENWLNEQYMQFIDPIYVDGTVDSIYVDTTAGTAWVVVDGVAEEFTFDPVDYPIIIHDENGMSFTIWPDGTIEEGSYFEYSNDQFGNN